MINANELLKGQTKAEPIEGDYEQLYQQIAGADNKKIQVNDAEENFDEMMVDEGVNATSLR